MKKSIITTVFILSMFCGMNAQTPSLPSFQNDIVVMKVFANASLGYDSYMYIDDGDKVNYTFSLIQEPMTIKKEIAGSNVHAITSALNQMVDQKYKLIGISETLGGLSTQYVFQKQ
jgi:hypothetical protein